MAVEAVTEYLERVAQLNVTGVLDKFGKTGTFLGLIHHKSTWWLHDSNRHRNVVGWIARPKSGTLQTVEIAWCDSPDPQSYTVGTIRKQVVPSSGGTIPPL